MARTPGIVNPLDPANPIVEPRTFNQSVPSWFFEDQLPPNPLGNDWGAPFPFPEDMPEPPPKQEPPSPSKKLRPNVAEAFAPHGARDEVPIGEVPLSIPFVAAAPPSAPGGIPGLLMQAGMFDPFNPDQPPAGGLLGLLLEHERNNPDRGS